MCAASGTRWEKGVTFASYGAFSEAKAGTVKPLSVSVSDFDHGRRGKALAVPPCTRGGRVVHPYSDHASVVKFIERNAMPAIGDLFENVQLSIRERQNGP